MYLTIATTYSSESRKSTVLFIFTEYTPSNLEILDAQLQVYDRLHIFSCEF